MDQPIHILKKYWGYNSFRPLQEDIIEALLNGHETLALLPTGGGKSICFQVPGMLLEGLTIVVSPLIALMKDQVEQLKARGISAEAIHAGQGKREIDYTLDNAVNSDLKFLYCSPERLKTEIFKVRMQRVQEARGIALIAVDEAHCVSQWGYDFRPAYLEIDQLRELFPEVPIVALTATATPRVKKDIQEKLKFQKEKVFTKSFARANLSYSIRFEEHKERKLLEVLQKVNGTSVVYTGTRRHAKEVAEMLQRHHISADFYHAGLTHQERSLKQENWLHNRTRVIVSTNAFGMGIDKPDVRTVVHMDLPSDLESYYQEAGRAGRDEKKAFAVIICNQRDIDDLRTKTKQSLPEVNYLRQVYQMIGNFYQLANGSFPDESFDFDLQEFSRKFDQHPIEVFHALKALQDQGLIHLSESFFSPSAIQFEMTQSAMYQFQIANAQFDALIKALLRLYGGELYQQPVKVQESNLAAILNTSVDVVRQGLNALHDRGIANFIPQKDKPQITLLLAKQDAAKMSIDEHTLNAKRKLKLDKMERVIAYVHEDETCRTQQLLHYFGEEDYGECGVCDNDIRKKQHADDGKFKLHYEKQITNLLAQNLLLNEEKLVATLDPSHKNLMLEVLSEMLDHGRIAYDDFGNLELTKRWNH